MKNDTAILVIDDDEQICFALGELFKFQGWKPYSAYDVESGLNEFKLRQPDIVLIDYHLPQSKYARHMYLIRSNPYCMGSYSGV